MLFAMLLSGGKGDRLRSHVDFLENRPAFTSDIRLRLQVQRELSKIVASFHLSPGKSCFLRLRRFSRNVPLRRHAFKVEGICMTETSHKLEEYRELLGMLGRMQLSDDLAGKVDVSGVVQVTFMEVHGSNWDQLPTNERVPWLRRVFANNLLDEIRKYRTQARDANREQSLQAALEQSALRVNRWLVSEQTSPSQKAVRMEDGLRLANALACLPVAQREAIELHHLRELPLAEISQRMHRSKGAVAALIFRGTTRLKELLGTSEEL